MFENTLYHGDSLDILRGKVHDCDPGKRGSRPRGSIGAYSSSWKLGGEDSASSWMREVRTMSTRESWEIPILGDVYHIWGARLWSFLNENDNVAAMVRASDKEEPAAKAIASELYRRFGDDVRRDRVKQFTGRLIKRVMKANGYTWLSRGHSCGDNPVFSVASRYVRRQ